MMQTLAKRVIALGMAVLMACAATFALAGCADDEQVIREGITQQLEPMKELSGENAQATLDALDSTQMEALSAAGIDPAEFYRHMFRGFDYSIGDIAVDGTTATVDVSITHLDVSRVVGDTIAGLQENEEEMTRIRQLVEDDKGSEAMAYVLQAVYETLDAETETVTKDVTVKLLKNERNEWNFDADSLDEMTEALYGNIALPDATE